MPSDLAINCRNLCREYYDLMDNRSAYVNKLQGELRMAFPQYLGIFSKISFIRKYDEEINSQPDNSRSD